MWAVLKKWTPRQVSPRNLGLAVAELSVPIGILIAFGSPYHSGQMAAHRKSDRRRSHCCAGESRKHAWNCDATLFPDNFVERWNDDRQALKLGCGRSELSCGGAARTWRAQSRPLHSKVA